MERSSRLVSISRAFYGALLLAYPASFRARFGDEMQLVFRDQCLAAERNGGFLRLWLMTFVDTARSALNERWAAADKLAPVWLVLGLAAGAFAAYVDFHNDEVQAAVLVLGVSGTLLGAIQPRHAWRWGLAVGIVLPLSHVFGKALGIEWPYKVQPNDYASFLAMIPAFVGCYFGVILRLAAGLPGDQPERRA
jgi:hypothetical protein